MRIPYSMAAVLALACGAPANATTYFIDFEEFEVSGETSPFPRPWPNAYALGPVRISNGVVFGPSHPANMNGTNTFHVTTNVSTSLIIRLDDELVPNEIIRSLSFEIGGGAPGSFMTSVFDFYFMDLATDGTIQFVERGPIARPYNFHGHYYRFGGPVSTIQIDNITIRTGPPLPEPSTWALLILGFGAVGSALRRARRPIAQLAHSEGD